MEKYTIFGGFELEFSDEEIRKFLTNNGYTIVTGEINVRKNHPIKLEKVECDVAFSSVDKNPDYYILTFGRKIHYMGNEFLKKLSKDKDTISKIKEIILSHKS